MDQMRMKHNETGRSMVEMLGVLAITGLLTLGGVAGYRYTVDKMNANEIIDGVDKRATIAASQRVLGNFIDLTEFHPNSESDFIKDAIYEVVAEEDYGRNPDFFGITIYDISKGVCDRISDSGYKVPSMIKVNGVPQDPDAPCEGSEDSLYDVTFIFDNTLGEKEYEECEVDPDCTGQGEICNQALKVCMSMPKGGLKDKDGLSHDCNAMRLIKPLNSEECSQCPNRTMKSGYCIPICKEDEFLELTEGHTKNNPSVRCLQCGTVTGYHLGTLDASFCNVCNNRYYFTDSWGAEHMCALRECGVGYTECNNGCCSCDDLNSIDMLGTLNPAKSCSDCDGKYGAREYISSGRGSCRLKNCPAGYFRHNNNCVACNSESSYEVTSETNRSNCLACTDDDKNKMRRLSPDGKYCVKANKCPNGIQEDDLKTPNIDESIYCASCPNGSFMVGNQCKDCDDPGAYDVTEKECNVCGGSRKMITITNGEGSGTIDRCMRIKSDGEFYSNLGTKSCTIEQDAVAYLTPAHCGACGEDRILTAGSNSVAYAYYCRRTCDSGSMLTNEGCKPCDYASSVGLVSMLDHVESGSALYTNQKQLCSTVCPGQRYERNEWECAKCPEGRYSIGGDATSCDGVCPESDFSDLDRGACIACGGFWNGSQCSLEPCANGEYRRNGICTACPENLTDFTGNNNEPYCYACGGIWDDDDYRCCPTDFSTITNQSNCQKCFGVWSSNGCGKCQKGTYGSENTCITCATADQIKDRQYCLACGYNWSRDKCIQ